MLEARLFEIEREDETLILTAATNLGEFDNIEANSKATYDLLADPSIKNLVVDFHKTDYFGSSAVVVFVHLWKLIKDRGGRMVLCNLSEQEKEILEVLQLGDHWPMCESRAAALELVSNDPRGEPGA